MITKKLSSSVGIFEVNRNNRYSYLFNVKGALLPAVTDDDRAEESTQNRQNDFDSTQHNQKNFHNEPHVVL
jgi:hypothetical protein